MEEKRNNEVESLAAFLHSGSESQKPAPAVQAEPVRPAPRRSVVSETITTDDKEKSLNDILFSFENKKRERETALRQPEPDQPVIYGEDEDDEDDAPVYEPSAAPSIPDYEDDDGHYDDAATQMMNAVRPAPRTEEETEEETTESDEDSDELTEEEKEERREIGRMKLRYEKQRQHTRTFAFILIGAVLCAGIIGVSAFFSQYIITYALDLTGIVTNDFRMDVVIPEDADTEMVAAILQENNIISSPKFFKWFADITKKEDTYIPGTYTLSSTMTYMTLFSTLQEEAYQEKTVVIRIVEGMTAREIGEILEENCVCFAEDFEKYYTELQHDHDFELRLSENSYKYHQMEGYLFPDTYEFYVVQAMEDKSLHGGTDDDAKEMYKNSAKNAEDVAKKIYKNFDEKITRTMYKKMGEMNMTLDEVITLASMVQKEAASVDDMYYVASVFLNRIRNSESFPKLESDVTILYVENEIKPYLTDGSIKYQRYADAYNTYTCNGIPAGPVCNPGLDAIDAVLNAAETNYFFFCANEDTGEVFYAETKEQHEENLILAELKPAE